MSNHIPNTTPNVTTENPEDFTTGPGFAKTARKAIVAFVSATLASIGPAVAVAGSDGVLGWNEVLPLSVIGLTLGFAAAAAVWVTPNAQG